MKSGKLISAMALLVALAIPISLAAQEHHTGHPKYKFVDLGTFGGPASYVNTGLIAINSQGLAIGGAETSVSQPPHSNSWPCGPSSYVQHGLEYGKKGGVRDLGALAPVDDDCSNTQGINASGEISGNSENGVIDPLTGVIEVRAVVWRKGQIRDLGTLGGNHSAALGINDRGQVVGFALNEIPISTLFLAQTQTRAFLWERGEKMRDLGTLGGPDAFAGIVNKDGQILGFSYTSSIPNPTTGVPPVDPFLWEPGGKRGKMIDLGGFGGTSGGPTALNNRGQVVGQSNLKGDIFFHPFFWEKGKKMQDLHTLGGKYGSAAWINDAGEVIGWANLKGDQVKHAVLWKKNGEAYKAHDLGVVEGYVTSQAFLINSKSQIVGCSGTGGNCSSATLWEHGSIIDLNKAIAPDSSLQLVWASFINDSGEIEGVGLPSGCGNTDTCGHAYVLIPCR